jgi:hypothetical protein
MAIVLQKYLKRFFNSLFITSLLLLSCIGCKDDPASSEPEQIEEGAWVRYSPYDWTHDGRPYPSEHCIIFSDGADYEMKKQIGEFADEIFMEILDLFNFENTDDFLYPPGHDKVEVYINMYHNEGIAAAYWGCIIITMRSHHPDMNRFEYLFKHELTHAFEFLIEGTVNLGTDVWFREGIAIYCGGGLGGIRDVQDLEEWRLRNAEYPGQGNPINIHAWEDFPPGSDITGYYYTVFDLTMRYFLDQNGLGKSKQDVLNLFYSVRNGATFQSAFLAHFGVSLEEFEIQYYDRMRSFLSGSAQTFLHPAGLPQIIPPHY